MANKPSVPKPAPKLVDKPFRHPKTGKFVKGVGTPQAVPYNLTSTMPGAK